MKTILSCSSMDYKRNSLYNKYGEINHNLEIDWGVFPDEYPCSFIKNSELIKGSDVYFLADFENPKENVMNLFSRSAPGDPESIFHNELLDIIVEMSLVSPG